MQAITLARAAADLANGRTTARKLVEGCLEAIHDPAGEGARTFLRTYADKSRDSADAVDLLRRAGRAPGPYAGIPISLKDLLDVRGETTAAGSKILADAAPAATHAAVVQRLLAAGFIPIGRTNMTEFAFSGIGINPHFGTPRAPWQRAEGRVPGGSSSGAAVSVADGMALAALGTDTGGSCRIPAAFCGVVGYKPTARRIPLGGVLPLSSSLDSVGPLANTVACCATVDAILAGAPPSTLDPPIPEPMALKAMRLAVPGTMAMDDVDPAVAEVFGRALNRLASQGVRVTHLPFPQFQQIAAANALGGFAAAESYAWHRPLLARAAAGYDPRVRLRIERGKAMAAADFIDLLAARPRIIAAMDAATAPFDAIAMPTSPIVPPLIAALDDDADFTRANTLALRNPSLANFLDRCSISLPAHRPGEPPVGFMLMGETGGDARLFAIAAAVEAALKE